MKRNERYDDDDGRTIADMSGLSSDTWHSGAQWLPRRPARQTPPPEPEQTPVRPWEQDPELTGKERFWAVLGALKATLLIAAVYLAGLAALLAVLFALWR